MFRRSNPNFFLAYNRLRLFDHIVVRTRTDSETCRDIHAMSEHFKCNVASKINHLNIELDCSSTYSSGNNNSNNNNNNNKKKNKKKSPSSSLLSFDTPATPMTDFSFIRSMKNLKVVSISCGDHRMHSDRLAPPVITPKELSLQQKQLRSIALTIGDNQHCGMEALSFSGMTSLDNNLLQEFLNSTCTSLRSLTLCRCMSLSHAVFPMLVDVGVAPLLERLKIYGETSNSLSPYYNRPPIITTTSSNSEDSNNNNNNNNIRNNNQGLHEMMNSFALDARNVTDENEVAAALRQMVSLERFHYDAMAPLFRTFAPLSKLELLKTVTYRGLGFRPGSGGFPTTRHLSRLAFVDSCMNLFDYKQVRACANATGLEHLTVEGHVMKDWKFSKVEEWEQEQKETMLTGGKGNNKHNNSSSAIRKQQQDNNNIDNNNSDDLSDFVNDVEDESDHRQQDFLFDEEETDQNNNNKNSSNKNPSSSNDNKMTMMRNLDTLRVLFCTRHPASKDVPVPLLKTFEISHFSGTGLFLAEAIEDARLFSKKYVSSRKLLDRGSSGRPAVSREQEEAFIGNKAWFGQPNELGSIGDEEGRNSVEQQIVHQSHLLKRMNHDQLREYGKLDSEARKLEKAAANHNDEMSSSRASSSIIDSLTSLHLNDIANLHPRVFMACLHSLRNLQKFSYLVSDQTPDHRPDITNDTLDIIGSKMRWLKMISVSARDPKTSIISGQQLNRFKSSLKQLQNFEFRDVGFAPQVRRMGILSDKTDLVRLSASITGVEAHNTSKNNNNNKNVSPNKKSPNINNNNYAQKQQSSSSSFKIEHSETEMDDALALTINSFSMEDPSSSSFSLSADENENNTNENNKNTIDVTKIELLLSFIELAKTKGRPPRVSTVCKQFNNNIRQRMSSSSSSSSAADTAKDSNNTDADSDNTTIASTSIPPIMNEKTDDQEQEIMVAERMLHACEKAGLVKFVNHWSDGILKSVDYTSLGAAVSMRGTITAKNNKKQKKKQKQKQKVANTTTTMNDDNSVKQDQ